MAHQKGDVIPAEAGIQTRQEDRIVLALTQRRVAS